MRMSDRKSRLTAGRMTIRPEEDTEPYILSKMMSTDIRIVRLSGLMGE
jgi:hypothetical protein